ncbi:MAG: NYN domain-containing protein [Chloroflexota bacterium]|nr:NYN domain-containing protein [Chloroflexota bacterium]
METVTYLFIDGGYLNQAYVDSVKEWFGNEGEIDFSSVVSYYQPRKSFYYDCEDKLHRSGESQSDYELRLKQQEIFFNRIREIHGCHVRLGHLSGSGTKRRRQKEVDIRLTVDMMNHVIRRNMTNAILVSGDRDFKPLVESLVDMGIHITLAADARSVSKDLVYAADSFTGITFEQYHYWSSSSLKSSYPISNIRSINLPVAHADTLRIIKKGLVGSDTVTLYEAHNNLFYINVPLYKGQHTIALESNNAERLELYFKLRYGSISWTQQ